MFQVVSDRETTDTVKNKIVIYLVIYKITNPVSLNPGEAAGSTVFACNWVSFQPELDHRKQFSRTFSQGSR